MTQIPDRDALREHYDLGGEQDRLTTPAGIVEFERTKELILRRLPAPPAVVADVGGGPGRYAMWLSELGYRVVHRDLMPLHVEQLELHIGGRDISTAVGDARSLDLDDGSVDAVLLLGPLYHLQARKDRLQALSEAARVLRPGKPLFAAAISRWAPRLHAVVSARLYESIPTLLDAVRSLEDTGWMHPLFLGSFFGHCHRPGQLKAEVRAAGFEVASLVSIEGFGVMVPDLAARLEDPLDRAVVFDSARTLEAVPELAGVGPHLLVTALRPN